MSRMALALRFSRLPVCACSALLLRQQPNCGIRTTMRLYISPSSQTNKQEAKKRPLDDEHKPFTQKTPPPPPPPAPPSPTVSNTSTESFMSSPSPPKWEECAPKQKLKTKKESAVSNVTRSKSEQVRDNVKGYVFTRYFDHVKNYDKVLEKNFPSAMKMYRIFFDGVKEFYADMKLYLKITRITYDSPLGMKALNRKELELYMKMKRDMIKVAPALIGSSLPMIGYVIFPLVLMYPRTFLTSHFWTLQQRSEFQQQILQERLHGNRPVLRCLQAKLKSICDQDGYEKLDNILGLLGSGFHPTVDAILDIKDVFSKPPYNLQSLSGKHIKLLLQVHGIPGALFKRRRLNEHAFLVHYMDLAIGREGGVHNMHPESIQRSCYIRGLNPSNLSNEEMVEWLRNWIKISTSTQKDHISLFLHLPLLLAYNHPNNWQLIYGTNKTKCKPLSVALKRKD